LENLNIKKKAGLLVDQKRRSSKQLSVVLEDQMVKFAQRKEEIEKSIDAFKKIHKLTYDHIKKKIYFKQ
jgi:hypothetical protein